MAKIGSGLSFGATSSGEVSKYVEQPLQQPQQEAPADPTTGGNSTSSSSARMEGQGPDQPAHP